MNVEKPAFALINATNFIGGVTGGRNFAVFYLNAAKLLIILMLLFNIIRIIRSIFMYVVDL